MRSRLVISLVFWTLVASATAVGAKGQAAPGQDRVHDPAADFEGLPIAQVEIRGNKHISTEELVGRLKYTRVGVPFNRLQTKEDEGELWNLYLERGFEYVRVQGPMIEETIGGIDVVITVNEGRSYRLASVSIDGYQTVEAEEIRALLRVKGGEFVSDRQIQSWAKAVRELYESKGYVRTKADPVITHSDPPGADCGVSNVRLRIVEGSRVAGLKIREIDFRGNEKISTPDLRAGLKYVKVGDQADKNGIDADSDRLRTLVYAAQGYLKAQFDDPVVERIEGGVKVTLCVREGRQYRLGKVTIEDNTAVSNEEIENAISLRPGEIIDGTKINHGLDALKELYGTLGYVEFNPDASIDWREPAGSDEGFADITFRMDEGKQYRIHGIAFRGATGLTEQNLRRIAGLKEGDVYNQERIDQSLKALNRLGLFEMMKPEDITINTNDRNSELDMVYELKPRYRTASASKPQ
ncbi:MAG TPA: POTRA domain-containing protein [Blastocatellia bacterium]|nr:POTRA domain-containing protein [Blastocatellia bacterium]